MQKHVPFLLFSVVFACSAFAGHPNQPDNWNQYRRIVNCENPPQNPSTDPEKKEALRCTQARRAFCGSRDQADCRLENVAGGGTTKAQIEPKLKEAGRRCRDTHDNAKKNCVTGQGSRNSPVAAETLQAMCKQLANGTAQADHVNTSVGGFCQGIKGRCMANCATAKASIDQMIAACTDCTGLSDSAEYNDLKEGQPFCEGLNPQQILDQARTDTSAKTIAEQCKNLTAGDVGLGGSQPGDSSSAGNNTKPASSEKGGGTKDGGGLNPALLMGLMQTAMGLLNNSQGEQEQPQEAAMNPQLDAVDCSVNPNLAGCPTASATGPTSWNDKSAAADGVNNSPSGGGFNVADESALTPASNDGSADPKASGTPPTVGSVPNGGGGVPGGAGGGAASLGGSGSTGGGAVGSKSNTNVLGGLSSGAGGMSAMNAGMNMKNGEGGGGFNYGQGGLGRDESGLDLSLFLPGGAQDPNRGRNVAGLAAGGSGNFQIQSKDVNIWARISERIKARCSQGLLRDCIP